MAALSCLRGLCGPVCGGGGHRHCRSAFLRTLFAHSVRNQRQVDVGRFLAFQRRILWISLITVYLAFAAVLCEFPRFYAAAIVLMGLYAMYYYYPSQQRIDFDKKNF